MHPKCAMALMDKDGKILFTPKGRTEVTTYMKVGGFNWKNFKPIEQEGFYESIFGK